MRDVSAEARSDGRLAAQSRLLLSKITPADGVRLALRLLPPPSTDPQATLYDWGKLASSLTFTIHPPAGPDRVLKPVSSAKSTYPAGFVHVFVLDAAGLHAGKEKMPWGADASGLLATPGTYTIRVEGRVTPEKQPAFDFSLPAMSFEVRPQSDSWLATEALVDAARRASKLPALAASDSQLVAARIVDDEKDGRWVRLVGEERGMSELMLDSLLSPAGKVVALYEYEHFSCVAEGTQVATPRGPVSIESLSVGDVVWGQEPSGGERVEVRIEHIASAARVDLVDIDGVRFTPEHPVWLDGRWTRAGDASVGASGLGLRGPVGLRRVQNIDQTTRVFDLTVSPPHTFFAGGLLVHNKAVPVTSTDPWNGLFSLPTEAPAPSSSAR